MPSAATEDVRPVLRPLVWLAAVLLLPFRSAGRAIDRFLEVYERGADAAGRAVARAARAVARTVVRLLGPLGRALRRALRPVWRVLRTVWDRAGLWLLLLLLRPMSRFARRCARALRPAVDRVVAWGKALARLTEPVTRRVLAAATAVDRAADRLGQRIRRVWAPVSRAMSSLSGCRTVRDG